MYVGFWVNFERPSGGKKRGRPLPTMLVTSCIHKRCTLVYINFTLAILRLCPGLILYPGCGPRLLPYSQKKSAKLFCSLYQHQDRDNPISLVSKSIHILQTLFTSRRLQSPRFTYITLAVHLIRYFSLQVTNSKLSWCPFWQYIKKTSYQLFSIQTS